MKKRNTIVRFNPETDPRQSQTDWEWLDKATDADIDFSDIPPLDEDFFRNAVLRMPRVKKMVSIRLDEELIAWYKQQGPGYQTRINAVLKAYMTAQESRLEAKERQGLHKSGQAAQERPLSARKVLKAPKGRSLSKDQSAPKAVESRKDRKGLKVRATTR